MLFFVPKMLIPYTQSTTNFDPVQKITVQFDLLLLLLLNYYYF